MRIVLLILMSVMFLASNGQSDADKPVSGKLPGLPFVFDQKEFGDRFSVLYYSEDDYDYYVIDLTKLGDRFERIYFMNLTYEDSMVVNLNPDIENDQIWFKAFYQYKEAEITCLFKDLKEKADKANQDMTAGEKSVWMGKFDKFKKNNGHE
ncbi:MAG: hypothetical protein M0Q51_07900 [Bacteroidales bacterium]|nr:hypothetical protein [Bacteroidales bacterium]